MVKHSRNGYFQKSRWGGVFTSDVNGLQGEGLLLIVNQSGLFCLVSHCRQWLCWAGVWAVWTRYTHTHKKKNQVEILLNRRTVTQVHSHLFMCSDLYSVYSTARAVKTILHMQIYLKPLEMGLEAYATHKTRNMHMMLKLSVSLSIHIKTARFAVHTIIFSV